MTDTDRRRLAAILGMLGSAHAGERAAAALQAEAFRRKHGLTWEQLVSGKTVTVYVDREVIVETMVPIVRQMPLVASVVDALREPWTFGFVTFLAFSVFAVACEAIGHILAG